MPENRRWKYLLFAVALALSCLVCSATESEGDRSEDARTRAAAEAVLKRLGTEPLHRFVEQPAAEIRLGTGEPLADWIDRVLGGGAFEVFLGHVGGGGGLLGAAQWSLTGSMAAATSTAASSGGDFALVGGVWSIPGVDLCADALFCDGFESGDTGAWSALVEVLP